MSRKRIVIIVYECGAPDEAFLPWTEVPHKIKLMIPSGLHCDGGGVPGMWCDDCIWGIDPDIRHDEVWHIPDHKHQKVLEKE